MGFFGFFFLVKNQFVFPSQYNLLISKKIKRLDFTILIVSPYLQECILNIKLFQLLLYLHTQDYCVCK